MTATATRKEILLDRIMRGTPMVRDAYAEQKAKLDELARLERVHLGTDEYDPWREDYPQPVADARAAWSASYQRYSDLKRALDQAISAVKAIEMQERRR